MFQICPKGLIQYNSYWSGRGWENNQSIIEASEGQGVIWLLEGCTKMDQNRPKWSPYYDPSMTKHKCFKFVLYGYFNPILIQMDT